MHYFQFYLLAVVGVALFIDWVRLCHPDWLECSCWS